MDCSANTDRWQIPEHDTLEFFPKSSTYCVCIPVINEGKKIRKQLSRMRDIVRDFDVILADGGSTDGTTDRSFLSSTGIRTLLTKTGPGKLSAQLRMAFAYALNQGYQGIITIDGNNKDSVESIAHFAQELESGFDFIQGSRFIPGGEAVNTPKSRYWAIRLLHAPIISILSGFKYTDTTNGFRAMSSRLLSDETINVFRDIFETYELLPYLSIQACKKGYRVKEIPVVRRYPEKGKIPTKISPFKGNLLLIKILLSCATGKYDTTHEE